MCCLRAGRSLPRFRRPRSAFGFLVPALVILLLLPRPSPAQTREPQPGPPFGELVLEGATVFSADDVTWLLKLRPGEPMPGTPEEVAALLQRRYERDGFSAARVTAVYDEVTRRLTLKVDEGRVDDVQFEGVPPSLVERFRRAAAIAPGEIYNETTMRQRLEPLLAEAGGALEIADRGPELVDRGSRRVLVVPIEQRRGGVSFGFDSEGREDFFNPVDGFAPALSMAVTRFDTSDFNHTFVGGHVSYKFASDEAGYSLGFEQPLASRPRIFLGGEIHDLTASDDFWRLSSAEQSLVALFFKNTFREYYRRRGGEIVGGFHARQGHELVASVRWDRHETLENETDFSFFRDDHPYRPNPAISDGDVHAVVLAYTWDTRGLGDERPAAAYGRHRVDDLFRGNRRQTPGIRIDWTSEIAGHGLGGDYEFDRHILNARGYVRLGRRQFVSGRTLVGFSGGALPVERRFGVGGIGTVHGYAFKEAVGEEMLLFNAEYRLDLIPARRPDRHGILGVLAFYDAGRVRKPIGGSRTDWLLGTGVGIQTGPVRIEFGFRADDIPDSRQILVRFSPTF